MDPIPIPSYTINLILQYISPPSQLASPIPSNLLSRSLLQRHSFLEISPEDAPSYLSWPSPDRDRAIQYLESLPMPLDELAPDLVVGYAVDPEHAYAHVHLKPTGDDGLRLVFEWDGEESWRYHDSNVMPFPRGTRPSLVDAVAGATSVSVPIPEFGEEKQDKSGNCDGDGDGEGDSGSDDDYWNSYGKENNSGIQLLSSTSKNEADASEDAYWAQYASYKKTRKLEAVSVAQHFAREEAILTLDADIRSRLRDPKAPPSPTTLAHRLSALSPRHSNTGPLSNSLPEPDPEEDIPEVTDDDTESPSSLRDDENPWELGEPQRNPMECTTVNTANSSSCQGTSQDDDGRALQDAVRGLFWLWKTRHGSNSSPGETREKSTEELDREDFLQLVSQAIAAPR
ncbi:hypothetical protein BJV74DRAFT_881451 [Russula compacta]|nr:hypothetical protein BJV74DRAFT_881451 [Russula compacta]